MIRCRFLPPFVLFNHIRVVCQLLVQLHTIQQSELKKGITKQRRAVQANITLSQLFTTPTVILSALVEDSYSLERGNDAENYEMIVTFLLNLMNNIHIEHNFKTGKNSLVCD